MPHNAAPPPSAPRGPQTAPYRVVQIGFHRCGTRSLQFLFRDSGYRALHLAVATPAGKVVAAEAMERNIAAGRKIFHGLEDYDFYADLELQRRDRRIEGYRHYARILADYPDTRFVLNLRDREAWIASRRRHLDGRFAAAYRRLHGLPDEAACVDHWRADWDAHLAAVRAFFADKPGRLVEFRIDRDPVETLAAGLPGYRLDLARWGRVDDVAARSDRAARREAPRPPRRLPSIASLLRATLRVVPTSQSKS